MIAGIVLAAGTSSRLGELKQLLPYRGEPLVQHAIDAASELDEIVIVLGHEAERVREAIELPSPAQVVVNPDYAQGQSTSVRAGLDAVSPGAEAVVVLLADQPGVEAGHVRRIIDRWRETGAWIVRAHYDDGPSHPVLLDRAVWDEVRAVTGDAGAREVMRAHPDRVEDVRFDGPAPVDVDTDADYDRLG